MANKNTKNHNKLILLPALGIAALSSAVVLGATPESFAVQGTANSTVTVTLGSVISVTASNIAIDLSAPTPSGVFASGTGTVSVTTNNAAGYAVYLTSSGTSTSLTNGSSSISTITTTETMSTTHTKFGTNNTWGWSSDNGVNYKKISPKDTSNSTNTPTLFWEQTSAAAASKTLTIGVTANTSLPAGQYTGTLLLTAITK